MINTIKIEDNTVYEYDIDCLKCKEEKLNKDQHKKANLLALLLCLYAIKLRKDV